MGMCMRTFVPLLLHAGSRRWRHCSRSILWSEYINVIDPMEITDRELFVFLRPLFALSVSHQGLPKKVCGLGGGAVVEYYHYAIKGFTRIPLQTQYIT